MFQSEEVSGRDAVLAENPRKSRVSKKFDEDAAAYQDTGTAKLAAVSNLAVSDAAKSEDVTAAMTVTDGSEGRRQGFEWKSLEGSLSSLHNKVDALSMRLSNVESVVEVLIQQKTEVDDNFNRVQEVLKEIEIRLRGGSGSGMQNISLRHGRDQGGEGRGEEEAVSLKSAI